MRSFRSKLHNHRAFALGVAKRRVFESEYVDLPTALLTGGDSVREFFEIGLTLIAAKWIIESFCQCGDRSMKYNVIHIVGAIAE